MAITEAYTGSAVTISTTEISMTSGTSSLQAKAEAGLYQAWVDLSTLAQGDLFEFRIYEKTLSSSTQRLLHSSTVANVHADVVWPSPLKMLLNGWEMTLKKLAGTDRALTWGIRKVA